MDATSYQDIKSALRQLYLDDPRPWLVGFSGGKDSTMLASLIVEVVAGIPDGQRKKPVAVLCTDTRVEIPAIVEMVESTLARMQKFSQQNNLNLETNLLKPPPEQSFWVNIIGRGCPPPNRTFRWCTQRLKIDPVTAFVNQRMGHWGEAILHLGARRAESSTRAQAMANRSSRNGLNRHPDLPRVWVSNPIEFLTTEEVWAYLLQTPNPWGGDNRPLYKLYASASNGECPIQIDTSTPSCGNSRFGYWAVDFDYESRKEIIKVPKRMGVEGELPGVVKADASEFVDFEERWTGAYIFENEWRTFRTRQSRDLELTTVSHTYPKPGRYTIAVKVIDTFGNDTMTLMPVTAG